MRNYQQLEVWKKAHKFTLQIYKTSEKFPSNEQYALTSQIRRACYSIPMNIAEGCGKSTDAELARFLDMASGSGSELDYQLLLARDLGYLDTSLYDRLAEELNHIRRMLTNPTKSVRIKNSD